MAPGDCIRRDIGKVSDEERARLISAIVKLDTAKFFPDGVSYSTRAGLSLGATV